LSVERRNLPAGDVPSPLRRRRLVAKRKPALTLDEERFVDEYLIDRNGRAAYTRANPGTKRSTAAQQASRLLNKRNVAEAVRVGSRELARACKVNAEKEIRGLAMLANYDIGAAFDLTADEWVPLPPRKIPYEVRQAIVGVKINRRKEAGGVVVETVEYRFADKIAARDKLMRHLGLYKDLPPLETVLALLPRELADEIRRRVLAGLTAEKAG
jgi:phage terminase small subunit